MYIMCIHLYLSIYLSVYLSIYIYIYLSAYLSKSRRGRRAHALAWKEKGHG